MKNSLRQKVTERRNPASTALDQKSALEILKIINFEDAKVAGAVRKALPQIAQAVDLAAAAISRGKRLIYLGAGTSGRLGVLDAAECLPTFGSRQVVGVLAGGNQAMFRSVEGAEDRPELAVRDLRRLKLAQDDVLVGIAASGRTPYTVGALRYARTVGAKTLAITCNPHSPMSRIADVPIVADVGPEVLAGSTRMKAGTAQKLVLNMLSTASMVRAGRVFSNYMVNVQLANSKLKRRGRGILEDIAGVGPRAAALALRRAGDKLPVALLMIWQDVTRQQAEAMLQTERNTSSLLHAAQAKLREKNPNEGRSHNARRKP
jgi:N-acetylmuramic acid 6-phosphate etherase